MGASGQMAIDAAKAVYNNYATTPYILVLTGALSELNGYAIVGEDTSTGGLGVMNVVDAFSRWEQRAKAVLFVGACATYGGVNTIGGNEFNNVPQAALPNHSGARFTFLGPGIKIIEIIRASLSPGARHILTG